MPIAAADDNGKDLTLVRPAEGSTTAGTATSLRLSAVLPPDLLEQVRQRVRLLAGLFAFAFGFDLVLFSIQWALAAARGQPLPAEVASTEPIQWANLLALLASLGLWWWGAEPPPSAEPPARHRPGLPGLRLLHHRVHRLLAAVRGDGNPAHPHVGSRRGHHLPPRDAWPPVRMLAVALLAAAMSPAALFLLARLGLVQVTDWSAYVQATFGPVMGAVFAYLAADVVYGLGREVARARELGSYRLGGLIGRGGMGEVYRATHRMLARPAAIKLIRPEVLEQGGAAAADLAARRFRREAEAAASLRSPHTVELYDFGVAEDRTLYFVMELLDGMDLETMVRQTGPLPAGRVIHVLRQVCDSLAEAHARGLVHRDIKPANIHCGRLGLRHDFVKVLDFGLVKPLQPEEGDESQGTMAGMVAGTPAYMAPEAARGDPLDGRADLYAVGCVGYFLLTGQVVFEAPNGLQVLARHLSAAPVPPSQRTELPVPAALEALLLTCLAKAPADRPPDADALATALAAVPVPPWTEVHAAAWWQAHAPLA